MKIGLFMDLRNPPAWRRPWGDLYAERLDRIEHAEQLGLDSVWLTEHHMFEDGYLPQPLTFAAAVAARTSRMRIGTGILLAPLRPAIDIAEQAALVDILSGGRLELGLGAGYRVPEFEAYGVDIAQRFPLLEQRAREVRGLWEGGTVLPPPLQDRPPIWIGGSGPRAARIAGRLGEGLLTLSRKVLDPYLTAFGEAGGDPAAARVSGPANLIVADDPESAWERIAPHLAYQWGTYRRYGAEGRADAEPGHDEPLDPETLRHPGPDMSPPRFDVVTAEEAVRRMREWLAASPVEHAFFWDSAAGMPAELADRHVELLATEVAPALRAAT
jgi:alkanesulfonate monooxygenase SsuD/methylene tetrahydromethanopterin reductase-like flavin-dependent oxidoreductase (luciferase family)